MRALAAILIATFSSLTASGVSAAGDELVGDYTRKNDPDSDVIFHFHVSREGTAFRVNFTGILHGGRGRELEGSGSGTTSKSGVLEFTFDDAHGNSGSGTLRRARKAFLLSMEPTVVKEPGLMLFYGSIRLTRDAPRKTTPRPNQAMQRTASKAATDILRVCHSPFGCESRCIGLAVADLVSR